MSLNDIKQLQIKLTREEYLIKYNEELEASEKEIEAGDYISQEALEKESESW